MLLDPRVRSFRVRAALGRQTWTNLASELHFYDLMSQDIPPVAATYLILGCRRLDSSVQLESDMAYVGQATNATAIRPGAAARAKQHQVAIASGSKKSEAATGMPEHGMAEESEAPKIQWAHRRLAHSDVQHRLFGLLSVFPFLNGFYCRGTDRRTLIHFHSLVTLAETIDCIFLGTLTLGVDNKYFSFTVNFGNQIRPLGMPDPNFESLNRALPIAQTLRHTGRHYLRAHASWSPQDVIVLKQIFTDHKPQIYGVWTIEGTYSYTGKGKIDYAYVQVKLEEAGIEKKTLGEVRSIVKWLQRDPHSEVESYQTWEWKQRWDKIYELCQALEKKGLVSPPRDPGDEYYHIDELEEGDLSYTQLRLFLERHRIYWRPWGTNCIASFGVNMLPNLLLKDVWENISGMVLKSILNASSEPTFNLHIEDAPPSLSLTTPYVSHRVAQRQVRVILRSIAELTRSNTVSAKGIQFQFTWATLMDVWRNSVTQLQMDGVPAEQIMTGGVWSVVNTITRLQRGKFMDFPHGYQKLEKWRYDPALDSITTKTFDAGHPNSSLCTEHNGIFVTNKSDEPPGNNEYSDVAYPWPGDDKRYEALALPVGHVEHSSTSERPTTMIQRRARNPMGQNRVTTLHYLVRIMKNVAQDILEGPLPLDYDDFWRTVWFHMPEAKWRIHSVEEAMERFEWVFHFTREGTMPVEAQRVKEALRLLAKLPLAEKLGAMLASSIHPYNQTSDCTITPELIGPDLCPEWFNEVITSQAASELSSILFRLHGLRLSRHHIQQKYGILIAYLCEEERPNGCGVSEKSTSHSLHSDSECQGLSGSSVNLTRGRETSAELSSLTPARFEIATSLKDKTLGPSCICRKNKQGSMLHCGACSQWFHVECVNMAESLAALVRTYICLACTSESQQTKFGYTRTQTRKDEEVAATEVPAASPLIVMPELDASGVQPCRQSEPRPSTIVQPVAESHIPSRITRSQSRREEIATESPAFIKLSKNAASKGIKRKRTPDARTDQDSTLAMTTLHSDKRVTRSASSREVATNTSQHADMLENPNSRRAMETPRESDSKGPRSGGGSWSAEEDEWLLNYKQRHPRSTIAESASAFNRDFPKRTQGVIQNRLIKLTLARRIRRAWSPEEEKWLLNYKQRHPESSLLELVSAFNRDFPTRTRSSIQTHIKKLGMPNTDKFRPWSTEEHEWILDLVRRQPNCNVTRDVADEFNRNFKPRSTIAIRFRVAMVGKPLGRVAKFGSPEKDKWLIENCSLESTHRIPPECLRAFKVEFGHSVTRTWMYSRLKTLGREPLLRKAPEELIIWLRSELTSAPATDAAGFRRITKILNDRFATSYSQGAIELFARTGMKGKSTSAGSPAFVPWTQDQREWLAATIERGVLPPLTVPQLSDLFYNHFGVRRTADSLLNNVYALGGQKIWRIGALRWIVEAVGSGISWGPMVALYQTHFESPVSAEQLQRAYKELMSSEDARARVETKRWTIEKASKGRRVRRKGTE